MKKTINALPWAAWIAHHSMKTALLSSVAGAAAGALVMWLILSKASPDPAGGSLAAAGSVKLTGKNQKLTERVQSLEKQLAKAKSGDAGDVAAAAESDDSKPKMITRTFDDKHMQEMMKERAERDANREADKLALRLKLTPEQKESLKKFLLAEKEKDQEMFRTAMKSGGKVEMSKKGGGKEAFLNSLLTPEQQAEYARSQEEQRTGRAEEYAQRKVRKLNNDLSLSEEQKDKLFQAYAQQKLTATDSAKQPEGGDVIGAAVGGAISFASVTADGAGGAEPIEIELDAGDFISPGSSDLDRETMQAILTPEQLSVYDQRKAEEQERMKNMIHVEGLPGPGASVRMKVEATTTAPPPVKNP